MPHFPDKIPIIGEKKREMDILTASVLSFRQNVPETPLGVMMIVVTDTGQIYHNVAGAIPDNYEKAIDFLKEKTKEIVASCIQIPLEPDTQEEVPKEVTLEIQDATLGMKEEKE